MSRCTGHCCQSFTLPWCDGPRDLERKKADLAEKMKKPLEGFETGEDDKDAAYIYDMLIHLGKGEEFVLKTIERELPRNRKWLSELSAEDRAAAEERMSKANENQSWWTCRHYDKESGNCSDYENRPSMCRKYPNGSGCVFADCTSDQAALKMVCRDALDPPKKMYRAALSIERKCGSGYLRAAAYQLEIKEEDMWHWYRVNRDIGSIESSTGKGFTSRYRARQWMRENQHECGHKLFTYFLGEPALAVKTVLVGLDDEDCDEKVMPVRKRLSEHVVEKDELTTLSDLIPSREASDVLAPICVEEPHVPFRTGVARARQVLGLPARQESAPNEQITEFAEGLREGLKDPRKALDSIGVPGLADSILGKADQECAETEEKAEDEKDYELVATGWSPRALPVTINVARVLVAAHPGWRGPRSIAAALGLSEDDVSKRLQDLMTAGSVRRIANTEAFQATDKLIAKFTRQKREPVTEVETDNRLIAGDPEGNNRKLRAAGFGD